MYTYYGASIREYDDGNVITRLLDQRIGKERPEDENYWTERWFQIIKWFPTPEEAEAFSMGHFI
jgi:hypothetical protein